MLDVGWYPEYEENGNLVVQVILDKNWDTPIYQSKNNNKEGCYRKDEEISAVWGFTELAEDEYYLYDLIEREKYAIKIFLDRKKEIEEFLNVEFDKSLR